MESQLTNNANALRLFFTEDIFLVEDNTMQMPPVEASEGILPQFNSEQSDSIVAVSSLKTEGNEQNEPVTEQKKYIQNAEIPLIANEPEPTKAFRFLGGNKKSVLILVNDAANDVSTEQGRELLRKIVKAIDLNTADFALVNYASYHGSDFAELHQFFKPQVMLAFGVEAQHLKLNLSWTGEIILHETTRIIFAPNLHILDSDLSAKKSLWGNLQKIK